MATGTHANDTEAEARFQKKVSAVPCPTCNAEAGQDCLTKSGRQLRHGKRRWAQPFHMTRVYVVYPGPSNTHWGE
jgi:hypothetical protein